MCLLMAALAALKLMGITWPSIVVASLAAWSVNSLPGTFSCPGTHWRVRLLLSLLNLSLKGAVSSDIQPIAFNRDWLSEQMAMLVWGFNTIHFMASLRAAFSSSYEEVRALPFSFSVSSMMGLLALPWVTTAAAPPFSIPALHEPSAVNNGCSKGGNKQKLQLGGFRD